MSVLIFIDHADGHIKKASLEAMSYGAEIAEQTGTTAEGVILGTLKKTLRHWVNMVLKKFTRCRMMV